MKMECFPDIVFEILAGYRGYLVIQYAMAIIENTQQVLDMENLFGT